MRCLVFHIWCGYIFAFVDLWCFLCLLSCLVGWLGVVVCVCFVAWLVAWLLGWLLCVCCIGYCALFSLFWLGFWFLACLIAWLIDCLSDCLFTSGIDWFPVDFGGYLNFCNYFELILLPKYLCPLDENDWRNGFSEAIDSNLHWFRLFAGFCEWRWLVAGLCDIQILLGR